MRDSSRIETVHSWLLNFPLKQLEVVSERVPSRCRRLEVVSVRATPLDGEAVTFLETIRVIELEHDIESDHYQVVNIHQQEVFLCTLDATRLKGPAPDLKRPCIQRALMARRTLLDIRMAYRDEGTSADFVYELSSELYIPLAVLGRKRFLQPRRPRKCPFTLTTSGLKLGRWTIRVEEPGGWRLIIDSPTFGGAVLWAAAGCLHSVDGDTKAIKSFYAWLQEECARWEIKFPFSTPALPWEDEQDHVLGSEERLALLGNRERHTELLAGHVAWPRFLRNVVDHRFRGLFEDPPR